MGVPQKRWMVFVRENPIEIDDNWDSPHFRKPPYMAYDPLTKWDARIQVFFQYGSGGTQLHAVERNAELPGEFIAPPLLGGVPVGVEDARVYKGWLVVNGTAMWPKLSSSVAWLYI